MDDAYMASQAAAFESAFNDALDAALLAKPADPTAFLREFFAGKRDDLLWSQQPEGATTPILPCLLTASTIDPSAANTDDVKRCQWISEQANKEYAEAAQVFGLIIASVAYDNAGVVWVVNELRDRMLKLVREMAELECRDGTAQIPGAKAATFVRDRISKTFAAANDSCYACFGEDPGLVHALLEDGSRARLREKLGVCLQCETLATALDAVAALLPEAAADFGAEHAAGDEHAEMAGWAESRLCLQLGLDLKFLSERRQIYLAAVESGACTPLAPDASLWDGWVTRWSRRGELWTRRQGEFRQRETALATQPKIDASFLEGLDLGLSAPESSFAHHFAKRKEAAAKAAHAHEVAEPEAEVVPWHTGDMCWEIVPDCDLAVAAKAGGFGLTASSSGTTFTMILIARYLGMDGDSLQLLKLAACAFLIPQHHTFLEVNLGASELCGAGTLAAGSDCWSSLLPPSFRFSVPSGPTVTRSSLNAEIEKEMRGEGDINIEKLGQSGTAYAQAEHFAKYRSVWPKHWLSPQRQRELSAEYDQMLAGA